MNSYIDFYDNVLKKKRFFVPILFFSIVSYSFSLYNRTISWDDLLRDHYFGSGNICLSGRWGMVVWIKLLGVEELDPFVDRFLALTFLISTAILLCYLLYSIDNNKSVTSYALFATAFITYPLINEIWEYCGANFILTSGLFLTTLATIVLRLNLGRKSKFILSSSLLLLPVSSYESSVFFYFSLVCIVVFYERIIKNENLQFKDLMIKLSIFVLPVFFAVILRFIISMLINVFYDLEYATGGATGIAWMENPALLTVRSLVMSNILYYGVSALVYFPITVFCILLVAFIVMLFIKVHKLSNMLLGFLVIVSLFSQAILQGSSLPYRNAQTLSLFVAFVLYLTNVFLLYKSRLIRYLIYVVFFVLCWHQAVYLNRTLCLNNLRSDNELSVIRQIGKELMANYDRKPVVIVTPYKIGEWINRLITVDESSLNGRLFCKIYNKITLPYKFVDTNINCATEQYAALKNYFAYCGFDVEITGPVEKPHTPEYGHKDLTLIKEATDWAKSNKMRPYQIKDVGDYLIVSLGNNQGSNTNGGISYFFDHFKAK